MASVAENVCVHCGSATDSAFVQYSPGNIRLSSCRSCGRQVDEYVECEFFIVLIDLMLLKPGAYRHVFFNHVTWNAQMWRHFVWKASMVLLLLDFFQQWLYADGETVRWHSFAAFATSSGKLLLKAGLSNFFFFMIVSFGAKLVSQKTTSTVKPYPGVMAALVISSYFKLFVVATLVWKFSPMMAHIVDLLTVSSNMVALKVVLNTTTRASMATIVVAELGRKVATCMVEAMYHMPKG